MTRLVGLLFPALLLAGCGSPRQSAESALEGARRAYAEISARAGNLAPDEAKSIQDALAQAQDDLARGNYTSSLQATRSLRNRVKDLGERLPAKQAELEAAWTRLDVTIPGTLRVLEQKLQRSNRPASGPRRAEFDASRVELSSLSVGWNEALTARRLGRIAEAVARAGDVKYRALRLLDETQDGS